MFENITLELSLKPFKKTDDAFINGVCETLFRQWYPLLKNRKAISVLMWTADGSELLDYSGNLDDTFEWCCYIGTANRPTAAQTDRPDLSIHEKKRVYTDNPPVMTYRILKKIVAALKTEGKRVFPNAEITVGETFDIGPEFAVSDFKYRRHREICTGSQLDDCAMVDSTAVLKADSYSYAAFPDGIPEGTPFGLFLGRQANVFLKEMGYDYLWFSNGLGFSANPWSMEGKIFDGRHFHLSRLEQTRRAVLGFWKSFREGCPDIPVETRGTNHSVGIDYATDGVPLYDLYNAGFQMTPPPNSPWAALNDDFGLELMGHMSRICGYPGKEILFRYYIHDPWWSNSPWYDRYDSNPHDIYLPMAVCRINAEGKTESANRLNLLSVDNSFGDMPDCCVNEPLPHLLRAEKECADEPAPFVWVYPMREYSTSNDEEILREMYLSDHFISDAINAGFPLNCVVSTDNFLKTRAELYQKSVLISPAPIDTRVREKLEKLIGLGIKVICYSSGSFKRDLPEGCIALDISESAGKIFEAAELCGYSIKHKKHSDAVKAPTMTVSRYNNGFYFSVYNTDTTTETRLQFPLGAPVLMCGETEIKDGYSVYSFARSEHRECRFFVRQKSGVLSVREQTPLSPSIHRRIKLRGLKDAAVCFFPETDYAEMAAAGGSISFGEDTTPRYDRRWRLIDDPAYGAYLYAEHITGDFDFFMPRVKVL